MSADKQVQKLEKWSIPYALDSKQQRWPSSRVQAQTGQSEIWLMALRTAAYSWGCLKHVFAFEVWRECGWSGLRMYNQKGHLLVLWEKYQEPPHTRRFSPLTIPKNSLLEGIPSTEKHSENTNQKQHALETLILRSNSQYSQTMVLTQAKYFGKCMPETEKPLQFSVPNIHHIALKSNLLRRPFNFHKKPLVPGN